MGLPLFIPDMQILSVFHHQNYAISANLTAGGRVDRYWAAVAHWLSGIGVKVRYPKKTGDYRIIKTQKNDYTALCIHEENRELLNAITTADEPAMLDALGDLIYVLYAAAICYGMPINFGMIWSFTNRIGDKTPPKFDLTRMTSIHGRCADVARKFDTLKKAVDKRDDVLIERAAKRAFEICNTAIEEILTTCYDSYINMMAIFALIHQSNFSKLVPFHSGTFKAIIVNGKVQKPLYYRPVCMEAYIAWVTHKTDACIEGILRRYRMPLTDQMMEKSFLEQIKHD